MSSIDEKGAAADLAKQGLHVVEIAQTPLGAPSIIASPDHDPLTNKALLAALKIYGKHYLASQDGIPGEGEEVPVILDRLAGHDPNVKAMSVYGLADAQGKLHGVSFIETYHIDETSKDGSKLEGLNHLMTYAAVEPPHDHYAVNAAFHAGIVEKLKQVDAGLGHTGNSILTTEVNAFRDYDGKKTSDLMDVEFEVKTGVKREAREAYLMNGMATITSVDGHHNSSHILQVTYTPPGLAGEESSSLAHINDPHALASHLRNEDAFNGRGEPLFLTGESLDGNSLNAHQLALQAAFQKQLVVSVARDLGVEDKQLVLDARALQSAGFGAMDRGYEQLIRKQQLIDGLRPAGRSIE